jgi:hypothetical protein
MTNGKCRFLEGQASRPAPGETSPARGLLSPRRLTVRRAPLFRLTGGSGRLSDPKPSFHQFTIRSSNKHGFGGTRQVYCVQIPGLFLHGSRRDEGNIAVNPNNRTLVVQQGHKRPAFSVLLHRRFFLRINLHPINTDWNRESVTHIPQIFYRSDCNAFRNGAIRLPGPIPAPGRLVVALVEGANRQNGRSPRRRLMVSMAN